MDKGADRLLLVETMRLSIGERIDPVEQPILVGFNRCLQGVNHRRIGSLPQKTKERLRVSHVTPSPLGRSVNRPRFHPAGASK
jgi:hypothetical protein